ncbi:O-antigen ligase family protein [Paludisphaera mucosa]|uniref:O-antigen ligase family protein n=1 Tax=Paludisphaera mucosa TaxID=3030827 RepID=A0ABT6FHD2_9BACT|nr:O-antigen ligase family protein [Paludisphaera mucosa]MDG3006993.1 O-antigen ligase family protein [Paludisphaera mucosa]
MASRGSKPPGPSLQGRGDRREGSTTPQIGPDHAGFESEAALWAERLRRLALGLLAALIAARAYWPSEPAPKEGAAAGLGWDLAVFLVAALALAPSFLTGRFAFRFAWTDAAVAALMFLTALSSRRAVDWRIGVNLAWEWAAMGVAYLLLRWLPRTRGESSVLALGMVVTAAAVAGYGIYQGAVEIPQLQAAFRRDPAAIERQIGAPGSPDPADAPRRQALENRVLQSNEVFGTFGLANSLAGLLVGPLVLILAMTLRNLARRPAAGDSRWPAVLAAAVPGMLLLVCLVLTKSRSAWLGLMVATAILAWGARRLLPRRLLLGLGAAGALVVAALIVGGLATGRLDLQVLTQSSLSMRYRLEYWRATWAMIGEGASTPGGALGAANFWRGVGPGNFGAHYVLYKLPQASEEIQDPHNLFLEVWATAGFWAFLALVAAVGTGLGFLLRSDDETEQAPADRPMWPLIASGLGLAMVLILGQMNLFMEDLLIRWLILVVFWVLSAALLLPLWRSASVPAFGLGAAAAAVTIDLLAAGGISYPAIAMNLWGSLALGLNLIDGRPSGRLRVVESRIPGGALAIAWAALVGSYLGATIPFWKSEAAVARAESALGRMPPDFDRAEAAYQIAEALDHYNVRPWLGHAYLQSLAWEARGAKAEDLRWKTIPTLLLKAASPPRSPDVWSLHSERAAITRDLLKRLGQRLSPREIIPLQASIVEATRTASRLYPTNASLHARLAEASAEISMFPDAAEEAREALRLDALTPHADKKLAPAVRLRLQENLPRWSEPPGGPSPKLP